MGRLINCFTVVILKFKMATILDRIWSISPPAGRDGKMISKCVWSAYEPYYVHAKIKSISSDTHQSMQVRGLFLAIPEMSRMSAEDQGDHP